MTADAAFVVEELARELAAAQAEIARLREMIPRCTRGPKACDAEIERLTRERDAARAEVESSRARVRQLCETQPRGLPLLVDRALLQAMLDDATHQNTHQKDRR